MRMRRHWHVSTFCMVKQVSTRAMPNATLAGAAAALAATPGVGAADAPVSQRFKAQVTQQLLGCCRASLPLVPSLLLRFVLQI